MSATTLRPEVRTALHQLIDYAGLFPPARLEMQPALEEYAAARSGGTAWMLGRFILALSRFEEAAATPPIAGSAARLPVSAIVDAEPDPRRWFESVSQKLAAISALRRGGGALEVGALEVPLPAP
ncbi:MAG TPA: hypothetical protein VJP76_04205, partial [Candidatus Tumulicola sp.]|nr:hypothetical protein [Candidatus Tumulicola sp.]